MTGCNSRLLAALFAAVVLAAATAGASANRLSIQAPVFRIIFARFTLQPSLGSSVICPLTVAGTFHGAVLTKNLNSLIGHVVSVSIGRQFAGEEVCEGGFATVLRETLPWHVQYGGFTGILPSISGMIARFIGFAMKIDNGSIACLFRTTNERPLRGTFIREAGGRLSEFSADASSTIPFQGLDPLCIFATARSLGSAALGSTTLTLI